jgi:hypothetical protein
MVWPANQALHLTAAAYSLVRVQRLTSRRGQVSLSLGGVQHTVARHWVSPRESAEFPTGVKGVVAMFASMP